MMSSIGLLFVLLLVTQSTSKVVAIDQKQIKPYTLLSSNQITEEMYILEEKYPSLVRVSTSQKSYNLPTAGDENDCPFDSDTKGCYNYFITIEDSIKHPKGSNSYRLLPEVLLSGALHGNERVGPTAVVETAKLLLEAAACEALPGVIFTQDIDINTEEGAKWLYDVEEGDRCRSDLRKRGILDNERKWLARLVSTRRIIIIPAANAVGYYRNHRTEMSIDPNRDFPFDVVDAKQCMQTIAGRTINEIFREHMFQISLTFHGGTEVVSYEWGAPTYNKKLSPDDVAQVEIGDGYARFAGDFPGTKQYKSGTMNALVYPVRGGMEDWAYAGSWDPERVIQCKPDPELHGPYDVEKTAYNNSTLRAFNMLIETSNNKIPTSHLGSSENVLDFKHSFQSNGHVARNIRLSLMAIDIVQPYVVITSVNGLVLKDDVIPMISLDEFDYLHGKTIGVPYGTNEVAVTWTVSGAFTVDSTKLYFSSMVNSPLSLDEYDRTATMEGVTKWSARASGTEESFTSFTTTLDISKYKAGELISILASAIVDQGWMTEPNDNVSPRLKPMSHIVNARINPEWRHESAGKIIQGQREWFSMPLMVSIIENSEQVVDLTNRFVISDVKVNEPHLQQDEDASSDSLIIVITLSVAFTFTIYSVVNKFMRRYYYGGKVNKLSRSMDYEDDFDNEVQLTELV